MIVAVDVGVVIGVGRFVVVLLVTNLVVGDVGDVGVDVLE